MYRYTTPVAVVKAKSVNDVRSTLAFANRHGLRLTVKNGGHSYMGYCLNEGGIVLDLSLMNTCYIDDDQMLIHMEGGLIWKDVYYKHLKDKRNVVIGGQCPYVGVSGFTLGAGLSPFSRSYGLGCDNLLEMTVVTWDGKVVTVSREDKDEEKRELFWALAGGGGGNFGVTVSLTSRMHKLRDDDGNVVCGQLVWNLPQQKEEFESMMNAFNTNKCPKELTLDALWSHTAGKQLTGSMTVIYNGGWDKAQEALQPLLAFNPAQNTLQQMKWTDWVHHSEGWSPKSKVFHHHASFIFPEGAITPELTAKISNLVDEASQLVGITEQNGIDDPKCHFLWDHIGAETEKYGPKDTAFYWREGHYVSNIKLQWNQPEKTDEIMEFIKNCYAELMPHAVDGKASYVNYIDKFVPRWSEAYYGENYARLQQVKTRWDPKNFFHNWQSIEPLGHDGEAPHLYSMARDASMRHRVGKSANAGTKKIEGWWRKYAPLIDPEDMGSPGTDEEVFERDCQLRKDILRQVLPNGTGSA